MNRDRTKLHCRQVSWLIALLCAMSAAATGQNNSPSGTKNATKPAAANPAENVSAVPTLNELKVTGARRSSYRKRERKPVRTETPKPRLAEFRKGIKPVLKTACIRCHGPKKQEGNIRIDKLDPDLLNGDDVEWWLEIVAVLNNGEMPPADATKLSDRDRTRVIEWLSSEIQVASAVRRAKQGHSSFRRMTRYEYNHSLQDLLGLPYNFAKDLPPEATSEDGFQNSSENLQMSVIRFGAYRELSRKALMNATVRGKQPERIYWNISMKAAAAESLAKQEAQREKIRQKNKDNPEKLKRELQQQAARFRVRHNGPHYKDLSTGATSRVSWSYGGAKYAWKPSKARPKVPAASRHVVVIPARQKLIVELGNLIPDRGTLRVRVRASRVSVDKNKKRIPSLQLEFGWQASNDSAASVRISNRDIVVDAVPEKPKFYQWDVPLSEIYPRNLMRKTAKMGGLPSPSEYVKLVNSSASQGDIQIDHVEVITPIYENWPPDSHTRIFLDSSNKADEAVYAREVLSNFLSRAWRRHATDKEIDQKLQLFAKIRPQCDDFQEAMVEVLATVLSSPKFLYLVPPGRANQSGKSGNGNRLAAWELATRLSVFLWSSMPDDELLNLSAKGRLTDQDVLVSQVKRMLADPRSRRFSRHFVRQWLGMQLLDFLQVDRKAFRQFDPSLKEAMQEEPIAFFHEVLKHNRSVLDFIHADYTMTNERLARHYGLQDVYGNEFRRVKLDATHNRGGLLTQAGLLAMNSDGKDSHPLKRGIWMLESLLNDPPPPPPPAVPEIDLADPKIAKLTLKERIENHRNHAACMSCHAKIDPWGIAFENYDAIGRWRDQVKGKPVDASSLLFNRQKLDGMDGLKRYLLANRQDQFARAMVHKLTTYALGRPLTFGDRSGIDQITADLRKQGDGLATMVTLIVTSELFRSK